VKRPLLGVALAAMLAAVIFFFLAADRGVQAQPAALPAADAFAVLLKFAGRDAEWPGSVRVSPGRVIQVTSRDAAADGASWTVRQPPAAGQKKKGKALAPATTEVTAIISAPSSAAVEVITDRGRFSFSPGELAYGVAKPFLGGGASAERTPVSARITSAPTEDDFPALAVASDGTAWCAYVAYQHGSAIDEAATAKGDYTSLVTKGHGDRIKLMKLSGGQWSHVTDITEAGLDVWRPAVAVEDGGGIVVVWPQNSGGNWDLFARRYDPAKNQAAKVMRLTVAPGADINPVLVAGSGGASIAWQSWQDGNFDIQYALLSQGGLSRPIRLSTSSANDWNPSIAAARGAVWVAWDTYDKGSYDVAARGITSGKPGPLVPIAASPRFEARPSIAADPAGRIWIAYEDAGENWGKDYGDRWPGKQGVPFYLERRILVRALEADPLLETESEFRAAPVTTAYDDPRRSAHPSHRISLPRLSLGGDGRLWLIFRRHPLQTGAGERWSSFASYYEGNAWAPEFALPNSMNTLDNRPALAPWGKEGILAVYSTDYRQANAPAAQQNDLFQALLKVEGSVRPAALKAAQPTTISAAAPVHPDEPGEIRRLRAYRLTAGGKSYRYLRGEFHRHTDYSSHRDWDGPLEEVWRYGLDVAAMDWIGPGDHDYGRNQEYLWWLTQKQVDLFHHAGRFIPMFTYERSIQYPSGHRNVVFAQRGIRPLPRLVSKDQLFGNPETGSPDIRNLYGYLKKFGGICSSHTSATNMGTDWRDNDPEVEPVVEIYQGHRQNYEETNAPLAARGPDDTIQGYQPLGFVWNAYAKGYRLGTQASSDHVSTHLSYAVVLAEDLSRESIIAAFKKRHSYAAHDNIVLDVRSGEHIMGDEFTTARRPELRIRVEGTAPVTRIDIVRQTGRETPAYVATFEPKRRTVDMTWSDQAARAGEVNMYYVRVMQENSAMAWASPMWIRYSPAGR
jgi:hypothetical protein